MPSETNETHLSCLPRRHNRFKGTPFGKNPVGVVQANDFVELHQIEMVGLQPLEGFVQLLHGGLLGAPVQFGHQKDFLPVAAF